MTNEPPSIGRQLRSLVDANGTLQLSIVATDVPVPRDDQVVVRVEAAPINPSDLGLLLAGADVTTAVVSGAGESRVVAMTVPAAAMGTLGARVGESLPVGNEGAGVVVAAGASPAAQALLGKTVGLLGGAMYSQYRCVSVMQCLELPVGTPASAGASCFVNPLTALGMVETMRLEGHTALVHTAAASNLGQMLNKICLADGVQLVNIVRKPEQAELLHGIGASYVCDSSLPSFREDLTAALIATGATLAFDATGGGRLAGQILAAMEAAANATAKEYSRYGSTVHKQVYIYGGLDRNPTEFVRNFGMAWGIGGWLLTPFLARIGPEGAQRLRERVVAELHTTFASSYNKTISLDGILDPAEIAVYAKQATGEKYLVNPNS
jgi:NADPH:quinone reductase